MKRILPLGGLLGTCALLLAPSAAVRPAPGDPAAPSFVKDIRPLLKASCGRCHNAEQRKGDVDFTPFTDERAVARGVKVWRKVLAQVEAGEMPPATAKPLAPEQRRTLLAWLKTTLRAAAAVRDPGPSLVRRFTVAEYNRTVGDLVGIDFNAAAAVGLSDDKREHGFDNLAEALSLSPVLMEKYFAAADRILDRVFGTDLSTAADHLRGQDIAAREALLFVKPGLFLSEREAARLILERFAGRAYRRPVTPREIDRLLTLYDRAAAKGRPFADGVRLMLKAVLVSPHFLFRFEQDQAPAGSATSYRVHDHEFAVRLSYFLWAGMPDDELMALAAAGKLRAAGPAVGPVKLTGTPIGTPSNGPQQGRERVFDGDFGTFFEGTTPSVWVGLDLGGPRSISLIKYAPRHTLSDRMVGGKFQASRTPDFSADVVDLCTIHHRPLDSRFTSVAVRPPGEYRYVRYLSPRGGYGNLSEIEVWGGEAKYATVLDQQISRMLADPRARSLTELFAGQWLQLRELPRARPSQEFFPAFSPELRKAMYDETATFFDRLRVEDRSILELLDADYTYVNEELAKHYKIPGVTGPEVRRVALRPEYHRGGLLGMGSVLALTSHTSRTSPTMRGKWILEVIFGTPPPPPPPDAGVLKEQKGPKAPKTFREKMALHAADATCAACHRKMDPLGYALENFNAVGAWRDATAKAPLDTAAELPGGVKVNGFEELRRVILKRRDEFVRNVIEQMLEYALGRELEATDEGAVQEIQAALARDGYRFSALVRGVVNSYPFQTRRNLGARR